MAKDNNEEVRTSIDNLNDSLTGIEQKVQNNQKVIMWVTVAAVAVVALIFIWIYAVRQPGINAADNAIAQADSQLFAGNDSTAMAQYIQVADEYGYDAGNRAALNAAILLYKEKRYDDAIKYLAKYDIKDNVIGAAAQALEGDCYVNLKQYDKALAAFGKAVSTSEENPAYTPYFMLKQATVLHEMKDYKQEAAIYSEILEKYPLYGEQNRIDIEKYMLRAQELTK